MRIKEINKREVMNFYMKHKKLTRKYVTVKGYGLYDIGELVGICTFTMPKGRMKLKGWFGFDNDVDCIYELMEITMLPTHEHLKEEFLMESMAKLQKLGIKGIIAYTDYSTDLGIMFQNLGFTYHGTTNYKTDFYLYDETMDFKKATLINQKKYNRKGDYKGIVNPRGKTKDVQGVWLERTKYHRYLYMLEETGFTINYKEKEYPTKLNDKPTCCNGEFKVYDVRYGVYYTCPKCTGILQKIR